jgi:hypothetical protein
MTASYVEFDEAPDECRCEYLILLWSSNAIYPSRSRRWDLRLLFVLAYYLYLFCSTDSSKRPRAFPNLNDMGAGSLIPSPLHCIRGFNMPEDQVARGEVERVIRVQLSRGG